MPRVTIPAIGSIGIVKDELPHELPLSALTGALNVRMRAGAAERMDGEQAIFNTPLVIPYWLGLYETSVTRFVAYAGLAAVYADDGGTLTDITGPALTTTADDRWTGGALNGVLCLNNWVDQPMYWGGNVASNLALLPTWDASWRAFAMRPFKNYLVGLYIKKGGTFYPNMVKWSAAADPGAVPASWDETDPSNDAGEVDLGETGGILVDALPLGDTLIIYKTDSMYAMTHIGGQYIFQFRRLPGEWGALARGCIANTPMGHVVLGVGDVYIHSGGGPTSILTDKLREWLFEQIDTNLSERSFVVSNVALQEAWICYPESGAAVCTKALVWNWKDNTFTLRTLNNVTCATSGQYEYTSSASWAADGDTWVDDTTTWNQSDVPPSKSRFLLGADAPLILGVDLGSDFNGTDYTASIERTGLAFDAPDRVKVVKGIYPRIDGTTGGVVYIQVGGAMDPEGSVTWGSPFAYTIGTSYFAPVFASGRFLAYRVYSNSAVSWKIKSMDFDLKMMGQY